MPLYDYKCRKCENEFEVQKSITDESTTTCPSCQSEDTERLVSRSSTFQLKGGGWTGKINPKN